MTNGISLDEVSPASPIDNVAHRQVLISGAVGPSINRPWGPHRRDEGHTPQRPRAGQGPRVGRLVTVQGPAGRVLSDVEPGTPRGSTL